MRKKRLWTEILFVILSAAVSGAVSGVVGYYAGQIDGRESTLRGLIESGHISSEAIEPE